MQTIKRFCAAHRPLLMLLGVALAAALVLAWAGFDLAQRVDNTPVYEIVNDDYSQIVALPAVAGESALATGLTQTLPVVAGQRLYGVRLDIATYDHAFSGGALYATLYTADGSAVATGQRPLLELKDNTFAEVIFAAPYTAPAAAELTLALQYQADPVDAGHPLGLWASEGAVAGLPLVVAGQPQNATAALQYVVDYSGNWASTLSAVVGVLLFLAVTLGCGLLFWRRAGLVAVFAVEALLLGGAFALVTPPLVAPDEYTHLAASYRQASTLLGQQTAVEKDGTLYLQARACDAPYFRSDTGAVGIFAYKTMLEHLGDTGAAPACDTATTVAVAENGYRLYPGQTLGIALARVLGLGFYGMLLLGRLGSLAVYTLLAAMAVALAPVAWRGLFATVALLPMATQLGASLSGDGVVLGLAFGYTALCLSLRGRPAHRGERLLLVGYALFIGPLKAIYLPVALLCLLVPDAHLGWGGQNAPQLRRRGRWLKLGVLAVAVAGWLATNLSALLYATRDVDNVGLTRAALALAVAAALLGGAYALARRTARGKKLFWGALALCAAVALPVALYKLTHMWGGLTPEDLVGSIQENGDSIYTYSVGYICRNLPGTVKLLLRSAESQGALWLQGVLGTALGEPIVYPILVSWVLGVGLVLALVAAALPLTTADARPKLGRRGSWCVGLVFFTVVGLSFLAALTWTPINYQTIFGVQGRYWLPVLPLALLLVGQTKTFAAKKDPARGAIFGVTVLSAFVLLQGYGLYATFGI
ncbi:MAG: DUF2142 domain-containing protein [Gemmiger sp.]|nr:DUF2142 domain-containing protein [Gemmiger sp.]